MRDISWLINSHDIVTSSVGKNTIRKYSEKYESVKIGDTVELNVKYVGNDNPVLREYLNVKSIALGELDDIVEAFGPNNHGGFSTHNELKNHLLSLYEEATEADIFIAVTFE